MICSRGVSVVEPEHPASSCILGVVAVEEQVRLHEISKQANRTGCGQLSSHGQRCKTPAQVVRF